MYSKVHHHENLTSYSLSPGPPPYHLAVHIKGTKVCVCVCVCVFRKNETAGVYQDPQAVHLNEQAALRGLTSN